LIFPWDSDVQHNILLCCWAAAGSSSSQSATGSPAHNILQHTLQVSYVCDRLGVLNAFLTSNVFNLHYFGGAGSSGVQTQGLTLARQMFLLLELLYRSFFCAGFFQDRIL
jgi:hypothetical protein